MTVSSPAQAAALVFQSNPLFTAVTQANAQQLGQSSSYQAFESGDGYSVSVTLGSGDCLASCINEHTWNYNVSHDGAIALVSEQGDNVEVSGNQGTAGPAVVTVRLVAGPVCPVERNPPDPSCAPRPVLGAEVVLRDPAGKAVQSGTVGDDGTVTFSVPAGAYYVESSAVNGLMGQAQPAAFSVPPGTAATVTLAYDTGIR